MGNPSPVLSEMSPTSGGTNKLRFGEKVPLFLEQTGSALGSVWMKKTELVGFFDWLGTKLKSHKFGFGFLRFSDVVSQKIIEPLRIWKGEMLKPTNFDVKPV